MWKALFIAVILGRGPLAPPPSSAPALKLYKAGRYDEACPLFRTVAEARKTDGAAWADLGLCELQRGKTVEGRAATLLALRHGDETVRRHAAYNWASSLEPLFTREAGGRSGRECSPLAAEPVFGCDRSAWTCVESGGNYGYGRDPARWDRYVTLSVAGSEAALKTTEGGEGSGAARAAKEESPPEVLKISLEDLVCEDPKECHEQRNSRCAVLAIDACRGRVWVRCESVKFDETKKEVATPEPIEERTYRVK